VTAVAVASAVLRRPIVAVLGSGDPGHGNAALAYEIGRRVARAGHHLLTGGGQGVMADACRGFASVSRRRGLSIGILPRDPRGAGSRSGYPNPWVEIPIVTHLAGEGGPDSATSRNPINVLSAWRIVALPGGGGTLAELRLAARAGRPLLVVRQAPERPEESAFGQAVAALGVPVLVVPPPGRRGRGAAWRRLSAHLGGNR
jgi:uncharacterized protein (TIGR00725 family)